VGLLIGTFKRDFWSGLLFFRQCWFSLDIWPRHSASIKRDLDQFDGTQTKKETDSHAKSTCEQ
jgi:hypothetical protein